MEEEDPGQLSGGVEVGPVDSGATVAAVEDEGLERSVERGQEREVGWVLGVLVSGMDRGPLRVPPPLPLARHFCKVSAYRIRTPCGIERVFVGFHF